MRNQILIFMNVLLLELLVHNSVIGQNPQVVEYLADSIIEKEGKYMRLLGGSSWVFILDSIALVADDVIIIFEGHKVKNNKQVNIPIAYTKWEELMVKHVGGRYFTETGYLPRVIGALDNGAVLKLKNGSLLSVNEYDQYKTKRWWRPPYKALLTSNKSYLYNLEPSSRLYNERVRVSPISSAQRNPFRIP